MNQKVGPHEALCLPVPGSWTSQPPEIMFVVCQSPRPWHCAVCSLLDGLIQTPICWVPTHSRLHAGHLTRVISGDTRRISLKPYCMIGQRRKLRLRGLVISQYHHTGLSDPEASSPMDSTSAHLWPWAAHSQVLLSKGMFTEQICFF